jgi:hypothetical protein
MTSQDVEHHQLYSFSTMRGDSLHQILSPFVVWGGQRKRETEIRVTLERKVDLCISQNPFVFSWPIRIYFLLLVLYFIIMTLVRNFLANMMIVAISYKTCMIARILFLRSGFAYAMHHIT